MAKYLDLDGLTRYNNKINTKLGTKADVDGNYEDMAVGQLLSNTFEEDKAPYNFRTAGGTLEIGDREYDTLVGGTVVWNQLVKVKASGYFPQNGITATQTDGLIELSGTSTTSYSSIFNDYAPIVGHKYIALTRLVANPNNVTVKIGFLNASGGSATIIGENGIREISTSTGSGFGIAGYNANTDFSGIKFYANIIDLTQMFGSTIADYIYSLEQATAGSGVAYFRSLFPKDYYAYNAGQLMSVKALSHKMVGFNQWDEEWEVGGINGTTGQNDDNVNNRIRSKNYIPILPNTVYYFRATTGSTFNIYEYDSNKNFIQVYGRNANTTFTPSIGTAYIRFLQYTPNTTTYNHDICINFHWDGERDGEYEAYSEHIYPLDSDLELRGIPKLDANNNLYYDGDTYESDGTVTRKYGLYTFTGNESWTWNSANEFWYTNLGLNPIAKSGGSGMNTKNLYMTFVNGTYVRIYSGSNTGIDSTTNMNTILVNGDKLLYELATPTTETADTFENPQLVDNWGTEEYTDSREVQIPVGHITKYPPDLKAKLESAPDSPASDGDYILRHNNGENSYVALTKELPAVPTTDGTYILKATVSSGVATLSWVAEE